MSFLVFAVASSAVGIVFVLWRHNRDVSVEDGMEEFTRGLRAIAPPVRTDVRTDAHASRGDAPGPARREPERE